MSYFMHIKLSMESHSDFSNRIQYVWKRSVMFMNNFATLCF